MKKSLIAALATSTLLFMACGDDDNPSFPDENFKSKAESVTQTATLVVDEDEQMLVMTPDDPYEKRCVVERDSTMTWKDVKQMNSSDTSKYEFRGDTLVIYDYDEGYLDSYGLMFVGGTAGNIYGTWKYISCEFDRIDEETECYEDEARYVDRTFKFSKGKVTAIIDYHFDKYLEDMGADGYMKSFFMYHLYEALSGGYVELEGASIFGSDDLLAEEIDHVIEENNITITKSTKTSQTFTIGEKTFTVTVEKADMTLNMNIDVDYDAAISVTDGSKTCKLNYKKMGVTKALCNIDNLVMGKLSIDEDEDADGNDYYYAYRYRDGNTDDFEDCINGIAVKDDSPRDIYDVYYKKVSRKDSGFAKRVQKLNSKMMRFIEK